MTCTNCVSPTFLHSASEPARKCDGFTQCTDGWDEHSCPPTPTRHHTPLPPPALVTFPSSGHIRLTSLPPSPNMTSLHTQTSCPDTHFLCSKDGYCLPLFVRCNGVADCPLNQDESSCDTFTCPGFYRCRRSAVCLHPDYLCDNFPHCPQRDDEVFCNLTCPHTCSCFALSFYCQGRFTAQDFPLIRFLHAAGSGVHPGWLVHNTMLVYLSLSQCEIPHLPPMDFPNLQLLDLSRNNIAVFRSEDFINLRNLKVLKLTGNPIVYFVQRNQTLALPSLVEVHLDNILLATVNKTLLLPFTTVQLLNLRNSRVEIVEAGSFQALSGLRVIDLRRCPLQEFSRDIFQGLDSLEHVYANNYKICCRDTLPQNFNPQKCVAPFSAMSSCSSLLRSAIYRVVLSVISTLALLGNFGSVGYRLYAERSGRQTGFGVFVMYLCSADFMMGVYLAIIGVVDKVYEGTYLWKEDQWRGSALCHLAGFLSLVSSEVSMLVMLLITLDRFLVFWFPFSTRRFRENLGSRGVLAGLAAGGGDGLRPFPPPCRALEVVRPDRHLYAPARAGPALRGIQLFLRRPGGSQLLLAGGHCHWPGPRLRLRALQQGGSNPVRSTLHGGGGGPASGAVGAVHLRLLVPCGSVRPGVRQRHACPQRRHSGCRHLRPSLQLRRGSLPVHTARRDAEERSAGGGEVAAEVAGGVVAAD